MGGNQEQRFQTVRQGQALPKYKPGGWVLFQRAGFADYWLGRTFDGYFMFGPDHPIPGNEADRFIIYYEAEQYRRSIPVEYDPQMPLF